MSKLLFYYIIAILNLNALAEIRTGGLLSSGGGQTNMVGDTLLSCIKFLISESEMSDNPVEFGARFLSAEFFVPRKK